MVEIQLQDDGSYALVLEGVTFAMPPEPVVPGPQYNYNYTPVIGNVLIRDYFSGDTPMFAPRKPTTGEFKAVKLTKANIKDVAGEIAKAGLDLTWFGPGSFETGETDLGIDMETFEVGDWVVEDYDYDLNHVFYRTTDSDERRAYDLR